MFFTYKLQKAKALTLSVLGTQFGSENATHYRRFRHKNEK